MASSTPGLSHLEEEALARPGIKLKIWGAPDFYSALIGHMSAAWVVALFGGRTQDDACHFLAANHGMIASFSRNQ